MCVHNTRPLIHTHASKYTAHAHTHAHARTHTRTHAHTHACARCNRAHAACAGLLLCPCTPDLAQRAGWLGGGAGHRGHVMALVQEALQAPGVMLPDARLEVLLEQALTAQVRSEVESCSAGLARGERGGGCSCLNDAVGVHGACVFAFVCVCAHVRLCAVLVRLPCLHLRALLCMQHGPLGVQELCIPMWERGSLRPRRTCGLAARPQMDKRGQTCVCR